MIDGISGPRPHAAGPRPSPARGATSFHVRCETRAGSAAVAGIPSSALAGMIALQEDEADAGCDREAKRRGADLLAALRKLQRQMLGAGASVGQLRDLAALAATIPEAADHRLRALVASIALRARIELARYDADRQR